MFVENNELPSWHSYKLVTRQTLVMLYVYAHSLKQKHGLLQIAKILPEYFAAVSLTT
jgi:hypothetical protein